MTNEEVKILAELLARESEQNREMAKKLLELNATNIKRIVDIMVDRRLCKLDAAQDALTGDEKPKFSVEPCKSMFGDAEHCDTHNRSVWDCVRELTERLG